MTLEAGKIALVSGEIQDLRDVTGRFIKGVSGNRSGRPKGAAGLAQCCQKATKDGVILVKMMMRIITGEEPAATVSDKIKAASWLADRAYGKPLREEPQELIDLPVERLNDSELDMLIAGEPAGKVRDLMVARLARAELAAALGVRVEDLPGAAEGTAPTLLVALLCDASRERRPRRWDANKC
jgi:hypothetical protein